MIVERRFLIGMPALLGASFLFNRRAAAAAEPMDFEEFTKQAGEHAKRMIADAHRNEYEYLFRIASLVVAVRQFPAAEFGAPFKTMQGAMSYRGSGIAVTQWRMEPNTVYQAHNHPGYNGMTIGLRGECRIRNFDVVGQAPDMKSKVSFFVRETQDNVLRPGAVTSMMSTDCDNIHQVEARNEEVIGADIIAKIGPDRGFSFVNIAGPAKSPQDQVYEATWGEHYGV